jgi:uncharacterized protein with WD repeat
LPEIDSNPFYSERNFEGNDRSVKIIHHRVDSPILREKSEPRTSSTGLKASKTDRDTLRQPVREQSKSAGRSSSPKRRDDSNNKEDERQKEIERKLRKLKIKEVFTNLYFE